MTQLTHLILVLVLSAMTAMEIMATEPKGVKFEVEADPLAYALGGASGHVAYAWKNERFQIGFGILDIPKGFRDNEAVSESFKSISLKWDYFINRSDASKGFFLGLISDYLFLNYADKLGDTLDRQRISAGIRTGYKFKLFPNSASLKGLYVTPWIGTSYLMDNQEVVLSGESFSLNSIKVFPTVHVGWSF